MEHPLVKPQAQWRINIICVTLFQYYSKKGKQKQEKRGHRQDKADHRHFVAYIDKTNLVPHIKYNIQRRLNPVEKKHSFLRKIYS